MATRLTTSTTNIFYLRFSWGFSRSGNWEGSAEGPHSGCSHLTSLTRGCSDVKRLENLHLSSCWGCGEKRLLVTLCGPLIEPAHTSWCLWCQKEKECSRQKRQASHNPMWLFFCHILIDKSKSLSPVRTPGEVNTASWGEEYGRTYRHIFKVILDIHSHVTKFKNILKSSQEPHFCFLGLSVSCVS